MECFDLQAIDLVSAVEQFHKLSCSDLSQLIRDSGNGPIRYVKRNGSLFEVATFYNLHSLNHVFINQNFHLSY